MYILNLETSTRNCSVSIAKKGNLIASKEVAEAGFTHAEKLHVFIESLLLENNITFSELSAVAVSKGPGSYTGLRIGVSAAKGLCYALDIPLIAIPTLAILASQIVVENGVVIPMIDARRMEVYSAVFDSSGTQIRDVKAEILTESIFDAFEGTVHIVGDSSDKAKTVLTNPRFIFHEQVVFPSAQTMAAMSYLQFTEQKFEDLAYFEPFYLKDFLITTK